MGGAISHFFQSGHALLSSSHNRQVSDNTRRNLRIIFDALRANPKINVARDEKYESLTVFVKSFFN